MEGINIVCIKSKQLLPYIKDLVQLRIDIFKEYPYLYAGSYKYETTYSDSENNIILLVLDNKNNIIGASTAVPLEDEAMEFQKPFIDAQIPIEQVFYFGESLLKKSYRDQGIYRNFFEAREKAARNYGAKFAAFAAVERSNDDSRRPLDYKPLNPIWIHFGYHKRFDLYTHLEWTEVGQDKPSSQLLYFWVKEL